ncbi:hypothetical protein [Marisediminicola senii]|uniref:hypothetical protein n=1 Tax=Marisediminicola senii TaxID=2711233 RepID=UPI0013EB69DB|nr:hypothetical protein [Marisediminicola senii]
MNPVTASLPIVSPTPTTPIRTVPGGLTMVGASHAAACEGDACIVPGAHEQAIVNQRLDDDLV